LPKLRLLQRGKLCRVRDLRVVRQLENLLRSRLRRESEAEHQ